MAKFVSKAQLKLADIEEIIKFLEDNIFQGVFSRKLKASIQNGSREAYLTFA